MKYQLNVKFVFWGKLWKEKDSQTPSFDDIGKRIESLFNKTTVLEMLQCYTIFNTDVGKKIKMIARYPQYEAINLIIQRVQENKIKRG